MKKEWLKWRERLRWGWISAALRGRAKEVGMKLKQSHMRKRGYRSNGRENRQVKKKMQESVRELSKKVFQEWFLHWLGLCLVQLVFHWKVKTETFTCSTGHLCPEPISLQTWSASSLPPTAKKMEWLRNNYFLLSLISKKECRWRQREKQQRPLVKGTDRHASQQIWIRERLDQSNPIMNNDQMSLLPYSTSLW